MPKNLAKICLRWSRCCCESAGSVKRNMMWLRLPAVFGSPLSYIQKNTISDCLTTYYKQTSVEILYLLSIKKYILAVKKIVLAIAYCTLYSRV
jgi:hypothetical protein